MAMWGWFRKQRKPRVADNSRAIRQYPELAYFEASEERDKALDVAMAAAKRGMGVWTVSIAAGLLIVGAAIDVSIGRYLRGTAFEGVWGSPNMGAFILPSIAFAGLIMLRIRRHRLDRSLREQLVQRGVPICLECGYDLRGQTEARCPECGTAFDPTLLHQTKADTLHEADTTGRVNP